MDLLNGRTPQRVESGAPTNIKNAPFATSATPPDKVINIKSDSSQIGGNVSDEELLKGLLTDQLCHVCNAVLLFKSQRLSHYEGKKHAQKLRMYLHSKRDEMRNKKPSGLVHRMPNDKDRFCELCNMVFSSTVVAKSHYEGRVHHKNLRKQSLSKTDSTEVSTTPKPSGDRAAEDSLSGSGDCTDPATNSNAVISDPNKFCVLCEMSFNNGRMATQHYNGRKHQRNKARLQMMEKLKELQKEDPLSCAICNSHFNSVEMYKSHMQGNKHYIREKKVFELCKSKKKSFNTFADQLAHYIEVQKARGIDPKIGSILCKDETQYEGSGQTLEQTAASVLYTQLLTTEFIHCQCPESNSCEMVFWFRTLPSHNKVQYLGRLSVANRMVHGDDVDANQFKFSKRKSEKFILQIMNVTKEDIGTYSCLVLDKNDKEVWLTGARLVPGEMRPTIPSESAVSNKHDCNCSDPPAAGDCDWLPFWSLAGLFTFLMITLFCTLFFFSRLPKKCSHHIVKC
ncbi:zinc finger matrin-type protein 1 isoform X2 [Stigmatopora argus]